LHAKAFVGLGLIGWFAVLACVELYCASRAHRLERGNDQRLLTNFGFAVLILATGAAFPLARLGASATAQSWSLGIGARLELPWLALFAILLLADSLAAYWVHRLVHRTPLFWRVHRVHHADDSVDVSTSLRNHPLELLLTVPGSAAAVLIVGASAPIVVAVQTIGLAAAIWQHADIELPPRVDRALAWVIVTPGIHRLHHNPERRLHDSNYGGVLTLWDRLFGTFNPARGRGRVGLDNQVASPDRLLQQIWSPVYAA
jgi:sterol desaturase/sphingolipid hydroxylase (fatty acid hydroxylase superfamily)